MHEKALVKGSFKKTTPHTLLLSVFLFAFAALYFILALGIRTYEFFIVTAIFAVMGALFLILYRRNSLGQTVSELVITENRVFGMVNNNRIDLPLSQITSIGTYSFGGISILTSSDVINVPALVNQNEAYECLYELIKKQKEAKA